VKQTTLISITPEEFFSRTEEKQKDILRSYERSFQMTSKRNRSAAHVHEHTLVEFVILTVLCLLLLAIQACSSAHPRNSGQIPQGKSAEEIISTMKERLHLSEDQVAGVEPIIKEACEKRNQIMANYAGQGREARTSMRAEVQELRKETETKLSTLLTSEQMDEYRKLSDEESQPVRHSRHGHGW
jgi:hypothetical protein